MHLKAWVPWAHGEEAPNFAFERKAGKENFTEALTFELSLKN